MWIEQYMKDDTRFRIIYHIIVPLAKKDIVLNICAFWQFSYYAIMIWAVQQNAAFIQVILNTCI